MLSVTGGAIFGTIRARHLVFSRPPILMVLSSAAASTQTTILPTAGSTLSMAAYGALPPSFAKIHPRYLYSDGVHGRDGGRFGSRCTSR